MIVTGVSQFYSLSMTVKLSLCAHFELLYPANICLRFFYSFQLLNVQKKKPWTCRNSCLLWVMSFGLQKIRIKCKGWKLNQLLKRKTPGNSMQISPWGFPGNCFLLLFEYLKLCSSTAVSAAGSGNSSHWTCIHAGRFTELTCLSCSTLTQQQSYTQTAEQRLDQLKCF